MSELRQALLDAIGEGPATTDDLVEATGYERRQVAVELQHMGGEGLVRSGRGGWRPIDPTAPPPCCRRAERAHTSPARAGGCTRRSATPQEARPATEGGDRA